MQGQNESLLGYHRTSYEGFHGPTPQDFSLMDRSAEEIQKDFIKDRR